MVKIVRFIMVGMCCGKNFSFSMVGMCHDPNRQFQHGCVCVNCIFFGEGGGDTEVHLVNYRAFQILD
jgi:hypothetical protein